MVANVQTLNFFRGQPALQNWVSCLMLGWPTRTVFSLNLWTHHLVWGAIGLLVRKYDLTVPNSLAIPPVLSNQTIKGLISTINSSCVEKKSSMDKLVQSQFTPSSFQPQRNIGKMAHSIYVERYDVLDTFLHMILHSCYGVRNSENLPRGTRVALKFLRHHAPSRWITQTVMAQIQWLLQRQLKDRYRTRWRTPKPSWSGIYDAAQDVPSCVFLHTTDPNLIALSGEELDQYQLICINSSSVYPDDCILNTSCTRLILISMWNGGELPHFDQR